MEGRFLSFLDSIFEGFLSFVNAFLRGSYPFRGFLKGFLSFLKAAFKCFSGHTVALRGAQRLKGYRIVRRGTP